MKDIDRPWAGKIRIIFFTFTMEWFKGEIDGSRYIEDEMYAIYTACMEYANALTERESTEETIEGQVRSSYEGLVTAWNSYQNLASLQASAGETLEKVTALNKLGKAEYSEVEDARESYQDAQLEAIQARRAELKAYFKEIRALKKESDELGIAYPMASRDFEDEAGSELAEEIRGFYDWLIKEL